jgi:sugar lactone lactonase YvrE
MRTRIVVAALLAVLALSSGVAQASLPLETIATFNPAAGEFPEGLAISKTNQIYVTMTNPIGEIRRIGANGEQSVLAHFDVPGLGPLGLATSASGLLYVAVSTLDPGTRGVYVVRADGTSARLPGTDGILFPNGLTLDKRGNVYATDSIAGAVWRIPPHGSAQLWVQDPLLEGTGAFGLGFPIGANGIGFWHNEIFVTNSEGGRLVRIPVDPDGGPGAPSVLAEAPELFGVDGVALGVHGNIYVAVIAQSLLVVVSQAGSIDTLATAADGLNGPSSLAFGAGKGDRQNLFILNFSVFSATPTPSLLKGAVGEPGLPLP